MSFKPGWESHSLPGDDLTARSLLTTPVGMMSSPRRPLQMDEPVTVRSVASGSHALPCNSNRCVTRFLCAALTSDGASSVRLRSSSLFSSPLPFVSMAVNDALLTARSHGRQARTPESADFTLPLPPKLHS